MTTLCRAVEPRSRRHRTQNFYVSLLFFSENPISGFKAIRDDLLNFLEPDGSEGLCIPTTLVADIIHEANGNQAHRGYHRCNHDIHFSYWIKGLARRLADYIFFCPRYDTYQTKRHRPYGDLHPLPMPDVPFHNICLDFMVALPMSSNGHDTWLTMICKFSKHIGAIPGTAKDGGDVWAERMLKYMSMAGWGFPGLLISDRDPKFLKHVWHRLFDLMGTKVAMKTARLPQADGQSERLTNTSKSP